MKIDLRWRRWQIKIRPSLLWTEWIVGFVFEKYRQADGTSFVIVNFNLLVVGASFWFIRDGVGRGNAS